MCVGFWCLDDPEYSLVLCTNRDEYLSRPTEPAHWHSFEFLKPPAFSEQNVFEARSNVQEDISEASVLSGIDTLAGGTWFGINNRGDVALLTNITEPAANMSSSRGHLCSSFLCQSRFLSKINISDFAAELTSAEVRYSGFNLLLLAPSRITHTDPLGHSPTAQATSLERLHYDAQFLSNGGAGNPIVSIPIRQHSCGCNGISNGVPIGGLEPFTGAQRSSEWPKVIQGREMLSGILAMHKNENVLVEQLFGLLGKKAHSPPKTHEEFQETIMIDPVNLAAVRRGPSFVKTRSRADDVSPTMNDYSLGTSVTEGDEKPPSSNYYATRLSTVLLIRRTGEVLFVERDLWLLGTDAKPELAKQDVCHERRFRFQLKC